MKAVYLSGIRQLSIGDLPEPKIENPDDVLLRVDVVGVCGSDMHYFKEGRIGCQVVEYPWIVGHELGATVWAVGPEVDGLAVGQKVAVDPLIACGKCDQCVFGRIHTCRDQKFLGCPGQLPGCMAQYIVMPARCCFPIPKKMTAQQAALTEPFAIALHARNLAKVEDGTQIAVLGCGPIGLCVMAALAEDGPHEIFATDLLDNRLEYAVRYGAEWTGNAGKIDVVKELSEVLPRGMDCVFECAGKQETIDQALQILTPGGTLVLVGIPPADRVSLDMNYLRRKELGVRCVRRQNECVEQAIEMVAGGKPELDNLVTHHFSLMESQRAFETVADYRDGVVKAMIQVSDVE